MLLNLYIVVDYYLLKNDAGEEMLKIKLDYGNRNLSFYRFIFNTVEDWKSSISLNAVDTANLT